MNLHSGDRIEFLKKCYSSLKSKYRYNLLGKISLNLIKGYLTMPFPKQDLSSFPFETPEES